MIELAVTLGITLSLLSIEIFGIAAGGIIVPGYIALQLSAPEKLLGLLIVSLMTFLSLKVIGKFTFLFGRRQMVVALLIGTIYSMASHQLFHFNLGGNSVHLSAIGWVVPGLIAHWSAKQGYIKTISMLTIIAVFIRLILIIINDGYNLNQVIA